MSNGAEVFDRYQRARKRREEALDAYKKAESEFIAADREHRDAKRTWYNDLLENHKPVAPHGR